MFSNKDYVYCIYKEKSFSKAADKLHISQPSLSATIAKVENNLETTSSSRKKAKAKRRLFKSPFFAKVIMLSAKVLNSLARGKVILICS